jgi:PAS domain S-box-containing protein
MQGLEVLLLRASPEGRIEYVNRAFEAFAGVKRDALVGRVLHDLIRLGHLPVFKGLVLPQERGSFDSEVVDDDGRRFSVRVTRSETTVDFVVQDITDKSRFKTYVERYVNPQLVTLADEDLRTFHFPERRFMTVSFSDLRGFTPLSESMRPEEVRSVLNAYLDAAIHAVDANGGTVDKIIGDALMVLYGAPRHYRDHAIRALRTCTDQLSNIENVRAEYRRLGKIIPDCGVGIHTGDMILGNMGGATRQDYTVIGANVNLASRLCGAARGGQILTTEATLRAVIDAMPPDWRVQEGGAEPASDSLSRAGDTAGMVPLDRNQGKVTVVGPANRPEFRFTYMTALRLKGFSDPVPVLAVTRCSGGGAVYLSDTVAPSQGAVRLLGRYQLLEKIGQGGVGEVWKGCDNFGNTVAVKILRTGDAATEMVTRRFRREAEVMAMLSHRNICRIHEVGESEGVTYIAMEYIDGVSLAGLLAYRGKLVSSDPATEQTDLPTLMRTVRDSTSRLGDAGEKTIALPEGDEESPCVVLPFQQSLSIMIRVCEAVQFAHEHGVMHRDLKPANIMLRGDGEPVVMDFGLAKLATPKDQMSLSITGEVMGTIEYMAPEQAHSSKDVREPGDVYSLGSVLYRMLTGRLSFRSSSNILEDIQRLQHHEAVPPRKINPGIDGDLETIVLKALRSDVAGRYHSVAAFKQDLEHYQRGEPISARRISPVERVTLFCRRNKTLTRSVAVMAVACLVVVGVLVGYQRFQARERYERFLRNAGDAEARQDWDAAVASLQSASLLGSVQGVEDRIKRLHLRCARRMIEREEWGAAAIRLERATGGHTDDPEIRQMMLTAMGQGVVSVSAPFSATLGELVSVGESGTDRVERKPLPVVVTHGTIPIDGLALKEGVHDLFLDSPQLGRIHLPARIERGKRLRIDVPFSTIPEGYVYVHGGPFLYGGDSTVHSNRTVGARGIDIPGFFMQRRPVLLGEYAEFYDSPEFESIMREVLRQANVKTTDIDGSARAIKDLKPHLPQQWRIEQLAVRSTGAVERLESHVTDTAETARGLSYYEAVAYARWRGARLPTEQEWEKAARGVDGRLFVSGNQPSTTCPPSTMVRMPDPDGVEVSPYGCYGLTQVLSQWTSSDFDSVSGRKVVRGSIASSSILDARVTIRRDRDPKMKYMGVGLILCKDIPSTATEQEKENRK